MEKNSGSVSMEKMKQFANSPAGQQILQMLQKANDPALKKAMAELSKGDVKKAQEALSGFSPSPELQKMWEESGG